MRGFVRDCCLLGIVAGYFAAVVLYAQNGDAVPEEQVSEPEAKEVVTAPRWAGAWEVGPELFHYQYKEPGHMEYTGWMYGIGGRVTRQFMDFRDGSLAPVFRVEGRYAQGETDYDGALQDGTPYTLKGVDATALEGRILAGLTFFQEHRSTRILLGVGYRFKDDDSSFDSAGYKRESTYNYIPIVLEHVRSLDNRRELAIRVEYDYFRSGEQVSDLSRLGLGKVKNDQNSGYGVRGSIAYSGFYRNWNWSVEPFVRYWKIDDSEITSQTVVSWPYIYRFDFVEPKNNTLESGLSFSIRF